MGYFKECFLKGEFMKKCRCGLNPNNTQSKEQQEWEQEYINKHGICSACDKEVKNFLTPPLKYYVNGGEVTKEAYDEFCSGGEI